MLLAQYWNRTNKPRFKALCVAHSIWEAGLLGLIWMFGARFCPPPLIHPRFQILRLQRHVNPLID